MKTLRLAITNSPDLSDAIRVYSSMFRMAYNRLQEGCSENFTWHKLKYRFLLVDYVHNAVFSGFYNKRKWKHYVFA